MTEQHTMKTLRIGADGPQTSALCLGTMYFGTTIDEPTSFALLDRWFDAGGRFLDTANNYAFWVDGGHNGASEELLGRWLTRRGVRDEIVLATKCGGRPLDDARGYDDMEGLSGEAIPNAVDGSLERLQTDRIDLMYAHWDDRSVAIEETVSAFAAVVAAGKALHLGCSNTRAWRVEQARATARAQGVAAYACVQQGHSHLRPRLGHDPSPLAVLDAELQDYAAAEHVGLLAYSPLLRGAYTREDRLLPAAYAGPDSDARLAALHAVCAELGATPNQVVLAWMMGGDVPIVPLVAASRAEQMDELLGALHVDLPAELRERLDAAGA